VLLAGDGDKILVGKPVLEGARVVARVNNHGRADKIIVYRYKSKTRYSNKLGHRQHFTSLTVEDIKVPELKTKKSGKSPEPKVEENQDGS